MGREHDQPNPALIIEGPRRTHPSKRIQGRDYPISALEELQSREKGVLKAVQGSSKKISNEFADTEDTNGPRQTYFMDPTRPVGDACRDDGTLKDADEMVWQNSPTGVQNEAREWYDDYESYDPDFDHNELPSVKPRNSSQSRSEPRSDIPTRKIQRDSIDLDSDDGETIPRRRAKQKKTMEILDSDDEKLNSRKRTAQDIEDGQQHKSKKTKKTNQRRLTSEVEQTASASGADDSEGESEAESNGNKDDTDEMKAKPRQRKDPTKDLRLCGMEGEGSHPDKKTLVKGWFCKFCLKAKVTKTKAFLAGNVSSRRRHLVRFHLDDYWATCLDNDFTPTPPANWVPPLGWLPPNERDTDQSSQLVQQSIARYAEKSVKPPLIPPVTKSGIQEHLLAIITTCDLPFRFVERPAVRGFITYLNHKLRDDDIPHKSTIAGAINAKVVELEQSTLDIIKHIPSKITPVWDGWSTRKRRPYTSFSICFIGSPPENDSLWELKKHLLEFNSPVGRHTGELIGQDLVSTIRKFQLDKKLGWMVGDGATTNDVAVRTVCRELDPTRKRLIPKQVRVLCIDHSMHRAAYHFIKALGVPSRMTSKRKLSRRGAEDDDNNEGDDDNDDDDDIDVSTDIDASADDPLAMAETLVVDFEPGDVIGKLLAFVNQVRISSEDVRDYLGRSCRLQDTKVIELRLWVRSRWGSLTHCLTATLEIQKAIDYFCVTADNEDLPPLTDRSWSDYRLQAAEWRLVKLVHTCLKVVSDRHNELSNEELATCTRVLPMMELLMSQWEELLDEEEYEPVHDALRAGIALLEKYYRRADDTDVYFIAHVLDPVLKLEYLSATWEQKYLDIGMKRFKAQFLIYKARYEAAQKKILPSQGSAIPTPALPATDDWIESTIRKRQKKKASSLLDLESEDPYEEIHSYLRQPRLRREACPNPIPWWGLNFEKPVLRMMARDYLAIPATTCIAERSFSLSARTDDPRRRQMNKVRFGGLQKLRAGYMDGRLTVEDEIMKKYIGDFSFDDEEDLN